MPLNSSLPPEQAPLALGIPIQPLTGMPLQRGERVYRRAHPITGEPLLDGDEPTMTERWAGLAAAYVRPHPTMGKLLDAHPLDADLVILVAGLFPRPTFDWTHKGSYLDMETDPQTIAEHAYMRAQEELATCDRNLPESIWQKIINHGGRHAIRALANNAHCPEHVRAHAALASQ